MPATYIERILRARVYDVACESPLTRANTLSRRVGNQVFLKREDLQQAFCAFAAPWVSARSPSSTTATRIPAAPRCSPAWSW